jgi:hypothetical protein
MDVANKVCEFSSLLGHISGCDLPSVTIFFASISISCPILVNKKMSDFDGM